MGSSKRAAHHALRETTLAVGSVLRVARRSGADALTDEERDALLADAVAGRAVRLELEAVTYIQREGPNRNYVRFKRGILPSLAASFAGGAAGGERGGAPFLRDHEQHNALARGGTVLESKLIEHEGAPAFWMRIELTAPWAVELALRGLLDRFSIGWSTTGIYECSICGKDIFDWRAERPCPHWPGQAYEVDGRRVKCEAVITDAEGVEVSAVTVPAVTGTEVQDIRAALAAARGIAPDEERNPKETAMLEQLRKLYGLPEGATEEQILAAARAADQAHQASRLAAEQAAARAAAAEQAERERAAAAAAAQLARDTEALIADCRRRVGQRLGADGQPVETELEASIRQVASTAGVAAARRVVDSLPTTVPAGTTGAPPANSARARVPVGAGAGAEALRSADPEVVARALNVEQRKVLATLGVKLSDVAKYGQEKPRKAPLGREEFFIDDEAAV